MNNYINDLRNATELSDDEIAALSPWDRVKALAQWHLGDGAWANEFRSWCEAQGLKITQKEKHDEPRNNDR